MMCHFTTVLFEAMERGDISAPISVLVAGEVLAGAKKAGNAELALRYRHIFSVFPNLAVLDVDMEIMEKMSDLRAKYGFRIPDAIHLATALLNGAQAFVTNDAQLKQVAELDVLVLGDYVGCKAGCHPATTSAPRRARRPAKNGGERWGF